MSFILEALKKSENARQRQTGPGLASLPERVETRRAGIWPWILGAVLMINAAVIAIVLFRDAPPLEPISQIPAPPTSGQVGGQRMPDRAPTAEAQGRMATETTAVTPVQPPETAVETVAAPGSLAASRPAPAGTVRSLAAEAQSAEDTGTSGVDPAPAAKAAAPPSRAATPPQAAAAANDNEIARMPSVQQLYLSGELTGPPLNLDLHVYFPQPSRRVVFISGTRYREGESVGQGVTVKEIIPAGVILEKRGQSYLLQAN